MNFSTFRLFYILLCFVDFHREIVNFFESFAQFQNLDSFSLKAFLNIEVVL